MLSSKIQKLIQKAQEYMSISHDPVHDLDHVKRVVNHAEQLSKDIKLSKKQKDIVVLASWWHDAGRVITKRPSFILMPFFDDILSAFMLLWEMIKTRNFGDIANITFRLILCKSMGTGALLTKILLRKKHRILLDIIHDADNLDLIHIDRMKKIYTLVDDSYIYSMGYKILTNWCLKSKHMYMKTKEARIYLEKIIIQFLEWIKQTSVMLWHTERYGKKWVKKSIEQSEQLLNNIKFLNLQNV
jgi:hypothetical protein